MTNKNLQNQPLNTTIFISELKKGTDNSTDLLAKVPRVSYDVIADVIRYKTSTNVLLLVNGIERKKEYIKTLSSENITRIEVLKTISQKYAIKGYEYVIDIITKDNNGYDLVVQNYNTLSLTKNNGNKVFCGEYPSISFTQTKKIN